VPTAFRVTDILVQVVPAPGHAPFLPRPVTDLELPPRDGGKRREVRGEERRG
jgi:hypothetical protein